jgi:hypothetical protein
MTRCALSSDNQGLDCTCMHVHVHVHMEIFTRRKFRQFHKLMLVGGEIFSEKFCQENFAQ